MNKILSFKDYSELYINPRRTKSETCINNSNNTNNTNNTINNNIYCNQGCNLHILNNKQDKEIIDLLSNSFDSEDIAEKTKTLADFIDRINTTLGSI